MHHVGRCSCPWIASGDACLMYSFVLLVILAGESVHHHICTLKLLVCELNPGDQFVHGITQVYVYLTVRSDGTTPWNNINLSCSAIANRSAISLLDAWRFVWRLCSSMIPLKLSHLELKDNCYCFLNFTLQFNLTSLCCTPLLDQIRVCCWAGVTTSVT